MMKKKLQIKKYQKKSFVPMTQKKITIDLLVLSRYALKMSHLQKTHKIRKKL